MKPTFCAIIPDRGDRPMLTEFCFRQLDRMTVKPDKLYHINYDPKSEGFDLVERVKSGLNQAAADHITYCFVIENDDYYPADYFERYIYAMDRAYDLIGDQGTIYYNLLNRTWRQFTHTSRSSLFTTAFKTCRFRASSIFSGSSPFLDISLWGSNKYKGYTRSGAIGIKHGLGLCGGKGHHMVMPNTDPYLSELRALLKNDSEAFEFYKSLSEELYKP